MTRRRNHITAWDTAVALAAAAYLFIPSFRTAVIAWISNAILPS